MKNVFISGIPNSIVNGNPDTNEDKIDDNNVIVQTIIGKLVPIITTDNYKIIKTFTPREGHNRHSSLVKFHNDKKEAKLMEKCKELKELDERDPLQLVYIKNEQPPMMTYKENSRLYGEFKKLCEIYKDNEEIKVKLFKGKLFRNDSV